MTTHTHACLSNNCSCEQIIRACRAANETFCECYNMAPLDAKGLLIVGGFVIVASLIAAFIIRYNRPP